MELLGLHIAIWIVLTAYLIGMLLLGWWSKRGASSQEGYLLGNRRFGTFMMIMHSFGAGTHPGAPAGVISKTVSNGASGIWVSWVWMFGTPFYWLIAPIVRRMRMLTMADYFEQRFSRLASLFYVILATVGMTVMLASVLLATTRTVQGIMGKTGTDASQAWFFSILLVITAVFIIYSYWGGIVAAIRTDMIQGLMIIVLSFLAIPAALNYKVNHQDMVGGMSGTRETLTATAQTVNDAIAVALDQYKSGNVSAMREPLDNVRFQDSTGVIQKAREALREGDVEKAGSILEKAGKINYLGIFDPQAFNIWVVITLSISAPLSMLAMPHLMSVCGAGRSEWEGRVGFTYGNILKRICTIGWSVLGLCWLAYLINSQSEIHPDAAFGDLIRGLLSPFLQGIMLACVMAAAMSSGDAVQVTVGGLISQNIYRVYIHPAAKEKQLVRVTRYTGLVVALTAVGIAILMRDDMVKAILDYLNILSHIGISVAMGIVWRRMNTTGVLCSAILAVISFVITRYVLEYPREVVTGVPILAGIIGGIVGSYLTRPPAKEQVEMFFKKINIPIGQEEKLNQPLGDIVPQSQRLFTRGGLFLVKPRLQSWLGFLVTLAISIGAIIFMVMLLR